jgi:hypothetical protein
VRSSFFIDYTSLSLVLGGPENVLHVRNNINNNENIKGVYGGGSLSLASAGAHLNAM